MSPINPPPFRFDCMGGFGDDDQRPAKRARRDGTAAGQAAPPPDGQDNFPDAWGPSQASHREWLFSHPIMHSANGSMPMLGSVAGMVPHSSAAMPINPSSMAASMFPPMNNTMASALWNTSFSLPPNPANVSAEFQQQPQHVVIPPQELPLLQYAPSTQLSFQPQVSQRLHPPPRVQPPPHPYKTQSSRSHPLVSEPAHQAQRRRRSLVRHAATSPFSDCIDSFGYSFSPLQFSRPRGGEVDGYIKFSWTQKEDKQPSRDVVEVTELEDDDSSASVPVTYASSYGPDITLPRRGSASPIYNPSTAGDSPLSTASTLVSSQTGVYLQSPSGTVISFLENERKQKPRYVPSHFGLNTKMDGMDRKLFNFYVRNWCPGRSVLRKTNLWLTDFARMHDNSGVLAAMQSLAGIYIHDYLPHETVRHRINERFAVAEARLSYLLRDPHNLDEREANELITLASLLSMQDIVLTERRLKKPYHPRWLTGFKHAESMLQLTDPGNRFYKESNVQVDALRLSQSVIVGRAVILAQPMMPLPPLATFDPVAETSRFGFLLYGSEREMYEIHGGCGFSKRLLHIFSQVAYCSARMLQDGETPIVPVTAELLYEQLQALNQWSAEHESWEAAQSRKQRPIQWILEKDETFVVREAKEMTEVTAEAWRLAGMVYLQCRLLRLPRNHPEVVANIHDLAKCISIMPTSGRIFTAQAPLLPVFFLGLLATVPDHVEVAHIWFQSVIRTPVRSSVPPLYQTLQRIQSWMDTELPVPVPNVELPRAIPDREPWWERMVCKVQEKEIEVLCLT